MNKLSFCFTLLLSISSQLTLAASPGAPYPTTNSYAEIFASMDAARTTAIENDRLLVYVMGANWCHDSLGMVKKLQDPDISPLLQERYHVQLINVGYLEHIREVAAQYNVPVIYGTPTVLVIEPHSNTLLNRDTLPYWRNADIISAEDTLTYFKAFEPGQQLPATAGKSPALQSALLQIDEFEAEQAERIYAAYAVLGPMLETWDKKKPNHEFNEKWEELAKMRSTITVDLAAMRDSAAAQAATGSTAILIEYPDYPLFVD